MHWSEDWNWCIWSSRFFRTMVLNMQQLGRIRPKGGFKPSKLCNVGAVLYQLSCQAIWEFIHTIDPHDDQLPVGLIAQLVEHCTGMSGQGLNPHSGLSGCCLSGTKKRWQSSTFTNTSTIHCPNHNPNDLITLICCMGNFLYIIFWLSYSCKLYSFISSAIHCLNSTKTWNR